MTRTVYRCLLRLHPADFRDQFAEEMLWIFDEAAAAVGTMPLLADVLASLARQWVVRSGAWKFGIGVLVDATLLSVLFLGPQWFRGGAPPKPAQLFEEAAAPPHPHYRLYVLSEGYIVPPKPPTGADKRPRR